MTRRNPIHHLPLLTLVLLAAAPPAAAADLSIELAPRDARYGDTTEVTGTVTDDAGAPLAGAEVVLVGRRYPFDGEFRSLARAVTDAQGAYRFEREFERNWQVRVLMGEDRSTTERVYVGPRIRLSYAARNSRVIAVTQTYRVPHGVDLERPTLFYVGPRGRSTAPLAARAETERVASGRFRARALVRIPSTWNGRFLYGSCFRYTVGSGMGNPKSKCPKRFRF
jgi:carboxypeptidase family protein